MRVYVPTSPPHRYSPQACPPPTPSQWCVTNSDHWVAVCSHAWEQAGPLELGNMEVGAEAGRNFSQRHRKVARLDLQEDLT